MISQNFNKERLVGSEHPLDRLTLKLRDIEKIKSTTGWVLPQQHTFSYILVIQAHMLDHIRAACRMILAKGDPVDRLTYVEEEGGTHDMLFFAKHFPEALQWLFT
ncbi:hypothetical protein [Paenibacillus xylanilyticus]|uniref:Esterase n=1 Tax=Paenibacillus xylanilyticus TaxID=248903 RepID=A0A7Y6C027_9BACL|nr:hypothetical protein [Paenibacillus xylanilyticus]NUU77688.1 hypothetical protein [Paenibacillus xylanilyticus]